MASCEKCWREAGGDAERYGELMRTKPTACTPEEQAGWAAGDCPDCKRRTVHQFANICMACGWRKGEIRPAPALDWLKNLPLLFEDYDSAQARYERAEAGTARVIIWQEVCRERDRIVTRILSRKDGQQ